MKKYFYVFCVFILTMCTQQKKEYTIGVAAFNYADEWASSLFDAIEESAKQYNNVEIIIADARNDSAVQIGQIENFVARDVDSIIILQVDQASFSQGAALAKKNNIPVVAVNRLPNEEDFPNMDAYVGINEKEAGVLQAKSFIEEIKNEGRIEENLDVHLLLGSLGLFHQIERTAGVIETLAAYSNFKIAQQQTADFFREPAFTIVENWLQADVSNKIKAIFANNDEMAIGALLAMQDMGRTNIKVYGIDATPAGLQWIGKGLNATIEQNPIAMGKKGFEIAYKLAKKDSLQELTNKRIDIPLTLINAENLSK